MGNPDFRCVNVLLHFLSFISFIVAVVDPFKSFRLEQLRDGLS